eukprot:scaffold48_cov311-Pinguiococcus_pyrenoidosus.AAC.163
MHDPKEKDEPGSPIRVRQPCIADSASCSRPRRYCLQQISGQSSSRFVLERIGTVGLSTQVS